MFLRGRVIGTKGQNRVPCFLSVPGKTVGRVFKIVTTSNHTGSLVGPVSAIEILPQGVFQTAACWFGGIAVGEALTGQPPCAHQRGQCGAILSSYW